jgi:hypothetical protein
MSLELLEDTIEVDAEDLGVVGAATSLVGCANASSSPEVEDSEDEADRSSGGKSKCTVCSRGVMIS